MRIAPQRMLKYPLISVLLLTLAACAHAQGGAGGTGGTGGTAGWQWNGNQTLQIATRTLPNGTIGVAYSTTIATRFGTAPLTFTIVSGALPTGLTLASSTGVISGTPGNNAGTFTFTVQVTDSSSTPQVARQQYALTILCTNMALVTPTTLPPADQGVAYSFQMLVTGGIAPLTWSATGLPTGEGINTTTGLISGTPTVNGTFTPHITVTDSCPLAAQSRSGNFVQQVNATLVLTTTSPLPTATVGTPYTAQLAAAGGTTPYTWALTSGTLPAGLSLTAATGIISGTPTNPQTTTPTIQVTDSLAVTASRQFSITAACQVLTISSLSPLPNGTQGSPYSFQLQSAGGFGIITWSATGLPAGLSVSSSGLISGTPTVNGTFTASVTVTDSCPSAQSVTQPMQVTISPAVGPLQITSSTTLPPTVVGQNYTQTLQATGGVQPYVWSVTANNFPPGILLNPTGIVSGVATTAGTYTPTVQVRDQNSLTTSAVFTLVTTCPAAPTISSSATLPVATQGLSYNVQLAATGGIQPYRWTLVGGAFPTGVSLSTAGVISGTPTQTGTFNPQIRVTDACLPTGSSSGTTTFTLAVSANTGALTITSVSPPPNGVQGQPYSTTITATGGTPPYSWTVPSATPGVGAEDILDYAASPITARYSSHLAAPGLYKSYRISAGLLWWIKNLQGYPWDIEVIADDYVKQWGTEMDSSQNAACVAAGWPSCFSDPQAYKLYRTPVSLWKRYHVPAADDVVYTAGPNLYDLTVNCGADHQTPIDNLGVRGELTGPFTDVTWATTYGGNVPDGTPYLLAQKWIKCTANNILNCTTEEDYWLVKGYGQVRWCSKHLSGGVYVTDTCTVQTAVVAGGAPNPNFACHIPNLPTPPNLPPGVTAANSAQLNLNDQTGAISGTPNRSGSYTYKVQVEDAIGTIVQKNFTQTITCPAVAISSTSPLPAGTQNQSYSFQFQNTGGVSGFTWTATGVPAGLTLSATGLLSGIPTSAATSTIAVTVTDSCSPTPSTAGPTNFSLTINAPTPPLTLVTTSPLPGAVEGTAYSLSMAAQGGVPPYSWSKPAGSFPAGLTMNTSGIWSGTPTSAGTQTPTIRVTDSASTTASAVYSITVTCPVQTITSNSPLPAARQGTAYSFQLTSSGGITPVSWGASGLPTGLTISASGLISGTPSVNGTFTPSITVTDSCAPSPQATNKSFTLQVNNNLAITTATTLPAGIQNVAYSTTLSAIGGTPPYTWAVTSGSLPTGLSLTAGTGVIAGTPTVAQTTTPTIRVTDSLAANISAVFSITIAAASTGDSRYCNPNETTNFPSPTDGPATLPTNCVYTPLNATPSPGGTTAVASGDATALQNALNAATCGSTITLVAGSTYTGSFIFPAHNCDSAHWITVRTTGIASLPPEGTRATPCYANVQLTNRPASPGPGNCPTLVAAMAKLKGSGTLDETIRFAANADHYRLIGLEVESKTTARTAQTQNIINMLPATSGCGSNHFIFDRMWVHGIADRAIVRAGIMQDGVCYVALIDSSVTDIHCLSGVCTDSQIFQGGLGNLTKTAFKGVNNYVESAGTNSMSFGGGGATVMPTDWEWRRNYQYKPWSWNPSCISALPACTLPTGQAIGYDGLGPYSVKNSLEVKNIIRALIEGNVMEGNWMHADQNASAILFTPKNQSGNQCPACVEDSITTRYNWITSSGGFLQAVNTSADDGGLATAGRNYSIHDNVAEDLNYQGVTNSGFNFATYGFQTWSNISLACGSSFVQHDVSIIHNTLVIAAGRNYNAMHQLDGPIGACESNMALRDNIAFYGGQGVNQVSNTACAGPTSTNFAAKYTACWTAPFSMTKNVIVNGTGTWPAGNFLPALAAVGFANYNNGLRGDYRLCSGVGTPAGCTGVSTFHNAASDGTDPGANINLVSTFIAGVAPLPTLTQQHSAVLAWNASPTSGVTYNVWRSTVNGGPYTLLTPSPISALTYTDTTVVSGTTYFYVVTSFDGTNNSVNSNQGSGTIP